MKRGTHDNRLPWVTASDIGKASYCPYSLFLQRKGYVPNREASALMVKGTHAHARRSRNAVVADVKRCYVATHAYGPDHYVTWILRQWRDNDLLETMSGRILVKIYYRVSPVVIKLFGESPGFIRMSRYILRTVANRIEKKWKS